MQCYENSVAMAIFRAWSWHVNLLFVNVSLLKNKRKFFLEEHWILLSYYIFHQILTKSKSFSPRQWKEWNHNEEQPETGRSVHITAEFSSWREHTSAAVVQCSRRNTERQNMASSSRQCVVSRTKTILPRKPKQNC